MRIVIHGNLLLEVFGLAAVDAVTGAVLLSGVPHRGQ
jgi:hypothetical protein